MADDSEAPLSLLLLRGLRRVERQVFERMEGAIKGLSASQLQLLSLPGLEEMTISDAARELNVSRQAMHRTVNEVVALGILHLEDAPGNRSAKLIRLSAVGREVRVKLMVTMAAVEQELAADVGSWSMETARHALEQFAAGDGPEGIANDPPRG